MEGRLDLRVASRALETFGRRSLDSLLPKALGTEAFRRWRPKGTVDQRAVGLAAWQYLTLNEYRSQVGFTALLHAMTQVGLSRDALQTMERLTRDEVVHVELCRRMVVGLGGSEVIPGTPEWVFLWPSLSPLEQVVEFVTTSLCIGETLSCALLAETAKAATDGTARAVLTRMTADESVHSQAGFHFLATLLPSLPAERRRWLEGRASEAAQQIVEACLRPADESAHPFGRMPRKRVRPVVTTTWRRVRSAFERLGLQVKSPRIRAG